MRSSTRCSTSIQLAFRRVPASLAVATLIVCTFWGIASGLVGAVVVLMGVIAFNPMLRAGYDVKLASGVITAGGTLGILIPPSVMIIVYAAVAGQSVVKLYAAAMFPGFFLAFPLSRLHRGLGDDQSEDRAAPAGGADAGTRSRMDAKVPGSSIRATCWPGFFRHCSRPRRQRRSKPRASGVNYRTLLANLCVALVLFALAAITLGIVLGMSFSARSGRPRTGSVRPRQPEVARLDEPAPGHVPGERDPRFQRRTEQRELDRVAAVREVDDRHAVADSQRQWTSGIVLAAVQVDLDRVGSPAARRQAARDLFGDELALSGLDARATDDDRAHRCLGGAGRLLREFARRHRDHRDEGSIRAAWLGVTGARRCPRLPGSVRPGSSACQRDDPALGVERCLAAAKRLQLRAGDLVAGVVAGADERT